MDQNDRTSRGSSATTSRSTGSTTSRSTGSSTSRSTATTSRSANSADRNNGSAVRSSSNVTRNGLGYNAANEAPASASVKNTEPMRDHGGNYRYGNYRYNDDFRMDNGHNLHRVPPRERDFIAWDRPGIGHFWDHHPHYYGYRVHVLPPHYRRITHWGIDYYFYEGIYYRPFGGVYVICRPPFGTPLERAIDRALFNLVRFSYYCNTYRTYNTVFDNYNVIAQQNLIIAQNNARIAYTTIVPPAGALVSSLPDDYETIVLNGVEYYMVDNTVYRTTLFDGQPYLEVLGQMYGSLYNQYSIYR